MSSRITLMSQACASHWSYNLGPKLYTVSFYSDAEKNLMYCHVPKAGCTFWGRIFSFLTRPGDMSQMKIGSPFDIDRVKLHNGPLRPAGQPEWNLAKNEIRENTVKFFFVRDPYARLWSVYLDKYYLPDFWNRLEISRNLCLLNITFPEFLAFAVTSSDGHMFPAAVVCNPCEFRPQYIGKVETFFRDSKFILDKGRMGSLLDNYSFTNYTELELKSIISNYFWYYTEFKLSQCFTEKDLCRRMWRVFQSNGHIRSTLGFPENLPVYNEETFLDHVLQTVRSQGMSRAEASKQRRQYLVDAYKNVSRAHILAIKERFKPDFEMFDYDKHPPA
ncbi:unnamed protein product [Lymnaea stagnalis]|uniref:Carbohydrate sulfotransferase n=1 Tax=Lymnaea stagnalis TaxID=6523 RepID=A0AAV2H2J6_LYMST